MTVRLRAHVRGIDARLLRRRAQVMLDFVGADDRELSILLCGAREMARLHEMYAGEQGATDVLAFPQSRGALLGDVVLCLPVLRREARARREPLGTRATVMLAHALLHLLGHDHDTPAATRRMEAEATRLLRHVEKVERKVQGR